jgi:acyl dehydratase
VPLDPDAVLSWQFPESQVTYTAKDTMLYALGVGLGRDPLDERELPFVYERDLVTLPTMAAVLGHPGPWYQHPDLGLDWVSVVHGEQQLDVHARLAPAGTLTCRTRVVDVEDKGLGRGALIRWQRELSDAESGTPVATLNSTLFCRKDGGFGGSARPAPAPAPWPDRQPDHVVTQATSPRAGLIYRLSGDLNPVHADPKVALEAGFDRPILHGLCTFALTSWAVISAAANGDPDVLSSVQVRFKAPVLPGQTLRTDMWFDDSDDSQVRFRTLEVESDRLVLDAGVMTLNTLPSGTAR